MKDTYKAPELKVVEFQVEHGYGVSDPISAFNMLFTNDDVDYTEHGDEATSYSNEYWNW